MELQISTETNKYVSRVTLPATDLKTTKHLLHKRAAYIKNM